MSFTDSSAASLLSGSRDWGGGSSNGTSTSGSLALAFPFPLSFPLGFSVAGASDRAAARVRAAGVGSRTERSARIGASASIGPYPSSECSSVTSS